MWNFWPKYWKKQKVVRNWYPLGWIDYRDGVLQKCGHFYPTVNICWFTGKRKLKMQALKLSFQTSKSHFWVKIFRNVFFQKFRLDILNPVEKISKGVFTEIFDILRFLTSEVTFRLFFICGKIEIPFFCHVGVVVGTQIVLKKIVHTYPISTPNRLVIRQLAIEIS